MTGLLHHLVRTGVGRVILGVAAFFAYAITLAVTETASQSACLARGFPNVVVTWSFTRYCVKRVEQTDVVERLQ